MAEANTAYFCSVRLCFTWLEPQSDEGKFTMKFLSLFFAILLIGCSAILTSLDTGGVERVDGTYRFEFVGERGRYWQHRETPDTPQGRGPYAYYFTMDTPRFVRYLYAVAPHDPVRNVGVYTRRDDKRQWELIKQIKNPLTSTTRIDINRRAIEIRLVQKTVSRNSDYMSLSLTGKPREKTDKDEVITGFEVYAQKVK